MMRIWRLPGPENVLSAQRICEQVRGEAVRLEAGGKEASGEFILSETRNKVSLFTGCL